MSSKTQRISKTKNGLAYSDNDSYVDCMCTYHDEKYHGLKIKYTSSCTECNGKGKIPGIRGGKKINNTCKTCGGHGYIQLDEPIILGSCACNGTLRDYNVSITDRVHPKDLELLFELIDFDNTIGSSNAEPTFSEQHLGFDTVGGVTDYGRYLKMTSAEFYENVKSLFLTGYSQYCHFIKNGSFPTKIIIRKTSSGWFLYPIYKKA